jgi:hypothetical protein
MLAGDGVEFLYTAVFRCKAPFELLSIYIVIPEVRGWNQASPRAIGALSALSVFSRASAGLFTGALRSS